MRLSRLAFVLGVAAVLAATASAQGNRQRGQGGQGGQGGQPGQPGRGQGGGFGLSAWVKIEAFQKDVGIEKEQADKISEALAKVQEDLRDQRPTFDRGGGAPTPEALREMMTKNAEFQKKVNEANYKALGAILKPEQVKRVKEIAFQVRLAPPAAGGGAGRPGGGGAGGAGGAGGRGFGGFGGMMGGGGGPLAVYNDPEIQTALKFTDDQKAKVKDINDDLQKEMRELFQGGGAAGAAEKIAGLRKEATEGIQKVLTADQKKMVEEMKGKEFDVSKLTPAAPGGPGGRRPGGTDNTKPGEKKKVDF